MTLFPLYQDQIKLLRVIEATEGSCCS